MQGAVIKRTTTAEEKIERIKRKLDNENTRKQPLVGLMGDSRICRGSTCGRVRVPVQEKSNWARSSDLAREMQRRKLQRADRVGGVSRESPLPAHRHADVQSSQQCYEKLTEIVTEYDADTETSFPHERPPSPVFMPAYSGSDVATQILDGDFFDFDKEVVPVLEVIVGRTIERALMEVLEEEEVEAIQKRQAGFQALRHAELLEAQRMEGVEKRRSYERERRRTQEHMRITTEGVLRRKLLSRQLAKHFVAQLEADVLRRLGRLGRFDDPQLIDVQTKILPNVTSGAIEMTSLRHACTHVAAELIEAACTDRTRRFNESRNEYLTRKKMVEAVVVAAEKESRIILEIEKMEAERINNEREMMKSWEAHEDPSTPEAVEEATNEEDGGAAEGR